MDRNVITKSWKYYYPLTRRFDWLGSVAILVLITCVLIAAALGLGGALSGRGVFVTIIENSFAFWMIIGIYALSCVIAVLFYRDGYRYEYTLTDSELIISRGKRLETVLLSNEMTSAMRTGKHIRLDSVTKLTYNRAGRRISLRGCMAITTIFANDDELEEVWKALKAACRNARCD